MPVNALNKETCIHTSPLWDCTDTRPSNAADASIRLISQDQASKIHSYLRG